MQKPKHSKSLRLYNFSFKAMGTLCDIKCYVTREREARRAAKQVQADVERLEQLYSRYRPNSLLSEINRTAQTGGEITVDDETAHLLNYAQTCYQQSDGLFDITSGVLRQAWRLESGQLPDQALIDKLLGIVGWEKLRWRQPQLKFDAPGMEIDFGGVVKEYAADRSAVICQNLGIQHGMVNLGGDIRVIGPMPDGSPWMIGIQHPRKAHGLVIANMELFSGGMATSGDYARCIMIGNQRFSHILNPKTGWPVRHMATVSVAANFCLIAGSATTIGMLKEQQGPQWLQNLGLPHVWMDDNGEMGGME